MHVMGQEEGQISHAVIYLTNAKALQVNMFSPGHFLKQLEHNAKAVIKTNTLIRLDRSDTMQAVAEFCNLQLLFGVFCLDIQGTT